jgi:hypothetical protein
VFIRLREKTIEIREITDSADVSESECLFILSLLLRLSVTLFAVLVDVDITRLYPNVSGLNR